MNARTTTAEMFWLIIALVATAAYIAIIDWADEPKECKKARATWEEKFQAGCERHIMT